MLFPIPTETEIFALMKNFLNIFKNYNRKFKN
jgi:hypothetical protein